MTIAGAEFGELRELKVAHPRLPSAAVQVIGARGNSYLVAIGVPRGGGSHAVLALTVSGRGATPGEIDALKAMLASFRYDPDHYCYPKGDEVEKLRMERKHWSRDSQDAEMWKAASDRFGARDFSLQRAALGCILRSQLFVPVACGPTEIDGKPVFLVDFYGDRKNHGGTPVSDLMDQHGRQIAIPWCFETRAAASPPRLVFRSDEPGTFQAFDCKEMRLGAPFHGEPSRPEEPAKRAPAAAEPGSEVPSPRSEWSEPSEMFGVRRLGPAPR